MKRILILALLLALAAGIQAQAPGSTPVKVSHEKQMLNGRKFYVHIVEKGQTVYSISRAYKVNSYDAVTHVDIHSLHPGDTVWLPFRGQFPEGEDQSTPAPAPKPASVPAPAPTTTRVDTVYVRDTTYINIPYAVHDTTVVTDTVTLTVTKYETVRDTTYINVPYAVREETVVTDTVTLTKYVPVHDTTYITVHDTTHINVPYAVHHETVVTDTVTLTKYEQVHDTTYITVHDTTLIDVPYAVHHETVVTDTVTLTKYVPVHDTTYITVHDTTHINVPYAVHHETVVTDTVTLTKYEQVHDTTYITVHDTTHINVPYAVHHETVVTDTVTLTKYVPVHDTIYITVRDTMVVTDTVTQTKYVSVHDTTYINVPYNVHHETVVTDTVTLTKYVPVHDTTYITVRDTMVVSDTVTMTKYVSVHDTTYIAVHDTTVVVDTVNFASSSSLDLAFASATPVALTEYEQASTTSLATEQSQRKTGKTLKVAVMMPLHLDQMGQISTSKFDIEQRGKKSYRQFEFIEFYEGILLALDRLSDQGINVELNVVDVNENSPVKVEEAFRKYNVAQSDFVVALLLRDCFDKAAELAQQAGVYIVNPMATRSELCAENPYVVKVQPSMEGMISLMLNNMKVERPDGHLYIIHSNAKAEKAAMDELKRQLTERGDIKYTIFNWSQSAKLVTVLKGTPNCNVLSIYDQDKDNNRVYTINLLNRLSSIKKDSPTLYTFNDWTREYSDIDFSQLQLLGYHTFSLSWDMTNEVHVQFLKDFRMRFGTEPTSQLASTGYDLMFYLVSGLANRNSDFWAHPTNSLPTLIQPFHLVRHGAGLENDKAQLYRMEGLRFVKALYK